MSINIKGATGKPGQGNQNKVGSSGKGGKSNAATITQKPTDDSVDLTAAATRMQNIEQSLAAIPIVDSSKVQAVAESIERGEYIIDEEKIASRIIEIEKNIKK